MNDLLAPPPRALSIAGSDPSGGAGLQADVAVFTRLGVHPMAVPTAITVQRSTGVDRVVPLAADLIAEQISSLCADMPPGAVKTGMLAGEDTVMVVAETVSATPPPYLVVDPVAQASSGPELLDDAGFAAMVRHLFPLAALITPNRREAERIWGRPVTTPDEAAACARALLDTGTRAVLVTGGHLGGGHIVDTLADEGGITTWRHPRHPGPSPHGTGCALSAAITAHLALGSPLRESVRQALSYVIGAVRTASTPGRGRPYLGAGDTETEELGEA